MKNGAELLDRLIKDIVSESAATYVSALQAPEEAIVNGSQDSDDDNSDDYPTAFSLARFIPLLTERIHVINPFTRTFLVSWITLLDSIPDLELVFYLPAFLGGLFKFLSDPNKDVHVATQVVLDRFLAEIGRIAQVKKGLAENRKSRSQEHLKVSETPRPASAQGDEGTAEEKQEGSIGDGESYSVHGEEDGSTEDDWVPGQDVYVDHPKILEILVSFLDSTAGIQHLHNGFSSADSVDQKSKFASRPCDGLTASLIFALRIFYPSFHRCYHESCRPWLAKWMKFNRQHIVSIRR